MSNQSNPIPPRLAQRILLGFLREDLAEEVLGDLDEKFYARLEAGSPFRAKLNYYYQVLHYFRPFAIRKSSSTHSNFAAMFESYFRIAWRNMFKHKTYSSIKIGGFALGIAACLLIGLFIRDELSYDQHIPNKDRIYRVLGVFNIDGEIHRNVWWPAPFASVIKQDYPEIEQSGRLNPSEFFGAGSNQIRRVDVLENTYEEGFTYADQQMLDILQVPLVYGERKHALDKPNTIALSKSKADKFFPGENPVGKVMILNNDEKNPFTVGGVFEDFPDNSHLPYDFFITMTGREFWQGEQTYWGATNYPTYIEVRPGTDARQLEKKMLGILTKYYLPHMKKEGVPNPEDLLKKASFFLPLLAAVLIGGQIGARMGATIFNQLTIKRLTAILILIVSLNILKNYLNI